MKNRFKYLCIAAGLMTAISVSAQEPAPTAHASGFHKGDTVVIKKDVERYVTGERISKWVYRTPQVVQQAGGRRYPDGILLRGILSWVEPGNLINHSTHPEAAAAEQAAKQEAAAAEKAAAEQAKHEADSIQQARRDSIANARVEAARADSIARAQEAARQDSIAQARQDSIIAAAIERARRDSLDQAAQDSIAAAIADSIANAKKKEQCNRFSIGVRGGAASLMHKTPMGNWGIGFDALLDLQYAHYWRKPGKKMQYGLLVGVGVGFARSSLNTAVNDSLPIISTSDGDIQYKILAENVKEFDGQIQVEVPLMFSMVHEKGFFMNLGPRFMIPVYGLYNQTITNPEIKATFVEEGVTVTNEKITGVLTEEQQNSKGSWKTSTLNIMLGAELGYEYTFRNKNSLGIGVYANYSVYTMYKNDFNHVSLISITDENKPDAGKPAVPEVLSATDAYATGLGYFDVGLKVAFNFNWWKKK